MTRIRPLLATCALLLVCAGPARAQASSPAIVTSDLANFYRALDHARGQDSASRVRIFRDEYILAGTQGLQDWTLLRLADFDALVPGLTAAGWTMPDVERTYFLPDSSAERRRLMAVLVPLAAENGAQQVAAITARLPRFYDAIRARVMLFDTSTVFRAATSSGLQRLQALVPDVTLPPVYLLVGRLTSGGTASPHGMLIGAEMSARGPDVPVDELSETQRSMVGDRPPQQLTGLVVHEAVHTMQRQDGGSTLLDQVLKEGMADFMASLALGDSSYRSASYQVYGRANEARLKREFQRSLVRKEDSSTWLYSWGRTDNHGAADLGYFIGFRICEAYYRKARDKQAALGRLVRAQDARRILHESGYLSVR